MFEAENAPAPAKIGHDPRQSYVPLSDELKHVALDVPGLCAELELCSETQVNYDNNTWAAEAPQQHSFVSLQDLELHHTYANVAAAGSAYENIPVGGSPLYGDQNQNTAFPPSRLRDEGFGTIKQWFLNNASLPYPNQDQLSDLAALSGRSVRQVKTCLTNLRARMKPIQDAHRSLQASPISDYNDLLIQPHHPLGASFVPCRGAFMSQNTATFMNMSGGQDPWGSFESTPGGSISGNDILFPYALENVELTLPVVGNTSQTTTPSKRKGKRQHARRYHHATSTRANDDLPKASNDCDADVRKPYHCTVCPKSFKDVYAWKRHESGVHDHVDTHWTCMLDDAITIGTKCVFCSDTVDDLQHFDRHDLHACTSKNKSERTFARKDLLKQHIQHVHLAIANDYTKRGFKPPDQWSEKTTSLTNPDALWCGFCQFMFESTDARMNHVAQHFRGGLDMTTWINSNSTSNMSGIGNDRW